MPISEVVQVHRPVRGWPPDHDRVVERPVPDVKRHRLGIPTFACSRRGGAIVACPQDTIEWAFSARARVLKEVFGNPFCPISLDPYWITPTALSLAQAAYDERIL